MEINLSVIFQDQPAVLLSIPNDPDTTTLQDVKHFLTEKYGDKCFRIHLPDIGTVSFPRGGETQLLSSKVWPKWTIPIIVRPQGDPIVVVVVLDDESTVNIHLPSSDTISELRVLIEATTKIPITDQVLSIDIGDDENEDHVTLADKGVTNLTRIHVTKAVHGGAPSYGGGSAVHMIDLFNQRARQENRFHYSSAARIYEAIGHGLVLEGVCPTRNCEAFGKRVFDTKRFGVFDMRDPNIAQCPACKGTFSNRVRSVGFNNCYYTIRGIERSRKEHVVKWTHVGDVERMWERTYAGVKAWLFLQIVTAPLSRGMTVPGSGGSIAPVSRECVICGRAIGEKNGLGNYNQDEVAMRPCEHSFHANCWNNWSMRGSKYGQAQRPCPMCLKN